MWSVIYSGVGSTVCGDGDPQALLLHNPTRMTHLRRVKRRGLARGSWEIHLASFPARSKAILGSALKAEAADAYRASFQLSVRRDHPGAWLPFPQTIERNPHRKGHAGLKD